MKTEKQIRAKEKKILKAAQIAYDKLDRLQHMKLISEAATLEWVLDQLEI